MSKQKQQTKVPVSRRAVMQRVNRKLAKEGRAGHVLKKWRGTYEASIGEYFVIDADRNTVEQAHVDLEELARELGALAAWESMTD